jgi:hypothetical protein
MWTTMCHVNTTTLTRFAPPTVNQKTKTVKYQSTKKRLLLQKNLRKKVLPSSNYQRKKYAAGIQGTRPEPTIDDFDVAPKPRDGASVMECES